MFAVPALPALEPLISFQEYSQMKRKLGSFNRFKGHPRASLPELKTYVDHIDFLLGLADTCRRLLATKENLEYLKEIRRKLKMFENVMIQVVLRGERLEDVLKNQEK
ncbi:hypothetical protein CRE_01585 [Caenorhabditis remanei]|uniref:Uncharacterized protein n=1 Tax=Caenorhabditis remanei TaxID=31234 RepID=E3LGL9_CAERE|nr:hypothetical protein CRE_01585 [Caenorhabditis remanei]